MCSVRFGVCGTALNWVNTYLSPRSCKVNIGKRYSTPHDLKFCVPQGSCSGPIFFLAYISTLGDIIPNEIDMFGFADDHILKIRFNPKVANAELNAITNLEHVNLEVKKWMDANKLKMNCSKTEFILFGSKTQLSKCITTNISICGDLVKGVSVIRYLGAWLDQNLNFKEHVNKKCTTAIINLNKIRNIRRYLTTEAAEVLVLSLVMSHLDYSIVFFMVYLSIKCKRCKEYKIYVPNWFSKRTSIQVQQKL